MDRAAAEGLTDLGNIAVAGAAALAALICLVCVARADLARRFGYAVAIAFVATAALKIVSQNLGPSFAGTIWALGSGAPSGHAAMAVVTYGGIAVLAARAGRGPPRAVALGLALAIVAAVAITRVTLHAHTPADVAAGLLVGTMSLAPLARRPRELPAFSAGWLLGVVAAAAGLVHLAGLRVTSGDFM